ncbi:MAG: hypothetical protein ACSLEN_12595 [Candidatus Malihini olakiniferum]
MALAGQRAADRFGSTSARAAQTGTQFIRQERQSGIQSELARGLDINNGSRQNVATGTTVTRNLHGKTYTGTTDANGKWSVAVPAAELQQLAEIT